MIRKEIKIFGKTINLSLRNDGDLAIANEILLNHEYRFCDEVIKKTKHPIIDIGGHLGFFSIYATLLNPNIPVYTFEPHEGNYQLLKQNIKDNRIKNIYPKNLAVNKGVGQLKLQISKEDLNHSLQKAIEPTGETQIVQTTTLERIFNKNRIEECDLIKMDCEGAEYNIIYNTDKKIFDKVSHIFMEYHDWIEGESHKELKLYLEKLGYKVEKYPNSKMKELGFFWCYK